MISEDNTANNEQGVDSKPEATEETSDYKSLYHREIQNNKKLRTRSQDAEARLEEFGVKQEDARKTRLQQEGEYKTLLAEQDTELKRLTTLEKDHNSLIGQMKKNIIDKFPEEEQEELSQLDLSALRILDKKISNMNLKNPPPVIGGGSKTLTDYDLSKMTQEEKKKNWGAILDSFKKN